MNDNRKNLKQRTKEFALCIIRMYSTLPETTGAQVPGKQVLRRGTSGGARYREGLRARSDAEFISRLEKGLQETDELMAMLTASVKTVKRRR